MRSWPLGDRYPCKLVNICVMHVDIHVDINIKRCGVWFDLIHSVLGESTYVCVRCLSVTSKAGFHGNTAASATIERDAVAFAARI